MSFVNQWGEQIEPEPPMKLSDSEIKRSQDITIVQLRKRNVSWRKIGKYLNLSDQGVRKRFLRIPPDAREHYERVAALG